MQTLLPPKYSSSFQSGLYGRQGVITATAAIKPHATDSVVIFVDVRPSSPHYNLLRLASIIVPRSSGLLYMWFPGLEYPRGQTFAIPYITECFYLSSVIILTFLAVLNTALAGNDIVTELRKSPVNIDTKWWAPDWLPKLLTLPTTPGPCQPLTIPQNDPSIRTNSSTPIFSYALLNGFEPPGLENEPQSVNSKRKSQALLYRSEPLQNCSVQNMTVILSFLTRGLETKSRIVCSIQSVNSSVPRLLKFSTSFSYMLTTDLGSDDTLNYISPYSVPWTVGDPILLSSDLRRPDFIVLGILNAIGSDLLKAMWAQKWAWRLTGRNEQWPDRAVVKWSAKANCTDALASSERCRRIGYDVEGIDKWYSNTRGWQDFDPEFLKPMNTTIYNYFIVLRDAFHLDLGSFDHETNIFLSADAFKTQILSDSFMGTVAGDVINKTYLPPYRGGYSSYDFWRTCTWAWGCLNGTWTDALRNNDSSVIYLSDGLPLSIQDNPSSTVIDVDYVCPVFKAKPTGPLLVSVFVGTFTMYSVLYGVFIFVAPKLDQRYRKKRGLSRFSPDETFLNTIGEEKFLLSSCESRS